MDDDGGGQSCDDGDGVGRSSRIGQLGDVDSGERIRHIAAEGRDLEGIIN
jgi:hypothetical protein